MHEELEKYCEQIQDKKNRKLEIMKKELENTIKEKDFIDNHLIMSFGEKTGENKVLVFINKENENEYNHLKTNQKKLEEKIIKLKSEIFTRKNNLEN